VILAYGGSVVGPLQQVSRTVPIVFVEVIDPVGAGFVTSSAGRQRHGKRGDVRFEEADTNDTPY